ncbi:MAG TPA: hypothetical protein DCZ94_13020 [Lentisphaeria bacterium]|nr:MAG: hypothetical protein A2X48_06150 [Lentisphaerae bacterium GWF2_49_21]HBC87870.1 hypothetical protein [Lentisphaeria bacterium]
MDKIFLLLFLFLIPVIFIVFRRTRKLRRRARLSKMDFPPKWEDILGKNVPPYRKMPDGLKGQLRSHIRIFLGEKSFEGCSGQKIDDEIRVVVAAFACILLLNRKTDYYPELSSILVYPDAYWVNEEFHVGGQAIRSKAVNLGESWENGSVILSWSQIKEELADENCGQSLIIHEFAHQVDAEDGFMNGLPELGEGSNYGQWAKVFAREYEDLREGALKGNYDVIDDYGRKDPSEFFAVATEGFFLKAAEMKDRHPELYGELSRFFKVDPSQWSV